jgi:hypothetical protein
MNRSSSEELNAKYRTAVLIEMAVFFITLVLVLTAWLLRVNRPVYAGSDLTSIWVLVLFIAAASFIVRRVFIRWDRLRDQKLLYGTSGLLKFMVRNTLILSLFALAISIAGFVSSILSGDRLDSLRAAAVAMIVLAVNLPRRKVWNRILEGLSEDDF